MPDELLETPTETTEETNTDASGSEQASTVNRGDDTNGASSRGGAAVPDSTATAAAANIQSDSTRTTSTADARTQSDGIRTTDISGQSTNGPVEGRNQLSLPTEKSDTSIQKTIGTTTQNSYITRARANAAKRQTIAHKNLPFAKTSFWRRLKPVHYGIGAALLVLAVAISYYALAPAVRVISRAPTAIATPSIYVPSSPPIETKRVLQASHSSLLR